jgi:hypothetical protein
MIELFDQVQDKVGEIYFSQDEKVLFLNTAQNLMVESMVYSRDPDSGLDTSKQIEDVLAPLKKKDVNINLPTGGNPTRAQLDTASGGTLLHVEGVKREVENEAETAGTDVFKNCKWMSSNDREAFAENTFKSPTAQEPWYSFSDGGLYIEPVPTAGIDLDVKVSTVKLPIQMTAVVNTDLPAGVHEKIVANALAIAGIASGDQAIMMFAQIAQ